MDAVSIASVLVLRELSRRAHGIPEQDAIDAVTLDRPNEGWWGSIGDRKSRLVQRRRVGDGAYVTRRPVSRGNRLSAPLDLHLPDAV
jgi:hypothetical protein